MDSDRMSVSSMGVRHLFERPGSDIRKTGPLKKLKSHRPQTLKKKFFVLRSTSASGPARLEYFDSEKKFKSGSPPKRSIQLHTCFNINRRSDSSIHQHGGGSSFGGKNLRHGLVLYLSDESFTVVADNEEEMEAWLSMLLEYQNEYLPDGDMHREHYEHVWQVSLQPRGLGKGTKGTYRLCLNDNTVCLVRLSSLVPQFTIPLVTIRSVAFSECIFRMDVGKYAPTGEGEFSLSVDDSSTAKDMHNTILHYMNSVKNPTSHKESYRRSSECQVSPGHRRPASMVQRPSSYYPPPGQGWNSLDPASPTSPGYPMEFNLGSHRTRSDTGDSHNSRASSHFEEHGHELNMVYNGGDMVESKEQVSVVPADMSPPSSPTRLDDEVVAYVEMDMGKQRQSSSSVGSGVSTPPSAVTPMTSSFHSHKGELPGPSEAYIAMTPHHGQPAPPSVPSAHMATAPIPIHSHSYSDPHHSTPLPTVREGGSNEGYVPMDSTSPASSLGSVVRPGPAKCMLSDDSTGMHPRTYSLGSKPPGKKYSGYVEMGPSGMAGKGPSDMPRATSVPHIILKGGPRRDRDSPTASASPLSMSLKSDDSEDSFMEYMPMRPRTASDSFNYNRPRTASFGNKTSSSAHCRPRSSSHGQGTRPFLGGRLGKEVIKQEPVPSLLLRGDHHRVSSQTSSPHGSFDSLRVSNESLRRLSLSEVKPGNLSRQQSGSNASDYSDARGTPSPKALRAEPDGYVNMQPGAAAGGMATMTTSSSSSSHRIRTDSASSSGRRSDSGKTSSSDRLHHQSKSDYAEMAPLKSSGSIGSATGGSAGGEAYISMDFRARHSFSSDTRPNMHHITSSSSSSSQPRQQSPSAVNQGAYMNMSIPGSRGQADQGRSVSMENVDSYVMYDPAHSKVPSSGSGSSSSASSGKPRTGSLGSKDKKGNVVAGAPRPGSGRKPSSNSTSSIGVSSSGGQHAGYSASMSTRTGGSSDSLRSKSSTASRQSSLEKYGSLGKDFRKKSASMGSRPVSKSNPASGNKSSSFSTRGDGGSLHPREQYLQQQQQQQLTVHGSNLIPIRKTQREMQEETADEYIEFAPTVTLQEHEHHPHNQGVAPTHPSSRGMPPSSPSGGINLSRSPTTVSSLPSSDENESGYTMYNPAMPQEFSAASTSPMGLARMAQLMSAPAPHPVPQASYIQGQQHARPHSQHSHSQPPSAHSPSSAHHKSGWAPSHPSTKDDSEYVGYEPGVIPPSHHPDLPLPSSSCSSGQVKVPRQVVQAKPDPQYVGFEPGEVSTAPATSHPPAMSIGLPHTEDTSEYVGYNPSKQSPSSPSLLASKPLSPGSAISYIQGSTASSKVNPSPGQPKLEPTIPVLSPSTSSSALSPTPKLGLQTPPLSTSSHSPTRPAAATPVDDSEYMGYNPAVPNTPQTPPASKDSPATKSNTSSDASSAKENIVPTPTRAVSYIQGSSPGNNSSGRIGLATPLKVDVGAGERNTRASSTPPLSSSDNTPVSNRNSKSNVGQQKLRPDKQDRLRQQGSSSEYPEPQHQNLTIGFHRAMSSPSGSTSDFPSPVAQGIGQLDSPSPLGSGPSPSSLSSRHKHSSGSSNSSQKSKRGVSSSSDSLRGEKLSVGNKSDSNSSLNSSTSSLKGANKRRAPSDSSAAGGWARDEMNERSPHSPALSTSARGDNAQFFCGESSSLSSQLEAKIVQAESRIRHSVGDMTTLVGGAGGGGSRETPATHQGQGLVRPGSTPCMHNLESSQAGVVTADTSGSPGGLQFVSDQSSGGDGGDVVSGGSRSRHSLSDLNTYQQQQQQSFTPGAYGSAGQAGSDAATQQPKALNYVKLDLSACPEGQAAGENAGSADGAKCSRAKNRNSSDADEKQPPVSYAEIDFVKSQNLSKAWAMGGGSGDEPSKS